MAPPGAEEIQKILLGGVEMLENAQKMYSEVFYTRPGPSLKIHFLPKSTQNYLGDL